MKCDREPSACSHVCIAGDGSLGSGLAHSTTASPKCLTALGFPSTGKRARKTRIRSRMSTEGSAAASANTTLSIGAMRMGSWMYILHDVFTICCFVISCSSGKLLTTRRIICTASSKNFSRSSLSDALMFSASPSKISPPASQITAERASGAINESNRRIKRITTTMCSFGFCCTKARMTTTASDATFGEG